MNHDMQYERKNTIDMKPVSVLLMLRLLMWRCRPVVHDRLLIIRLLYLEGLRVWG